MSVFKMRRTDQMNTHSSIKNPARVSCSTSPCIRRPFRPSAVGLASMAEPISTVTIAWTLVDAGEARQLVLNPVGSVNADDDLRVAQTDHVAIGQLPLLYGCVVDGSAVSGVEVGEERDLAIPADLQVTARHPGVRQPELGVLP